MAMAMNEVGSENVVAGSLSERENAKKVMLNTIRPLPLKHNWTFWYDKYPYPSSKLI